MKESSINKQKIDTLTKENDESKKSLTSANETVLRHKDEITKSQEILKKLETSSKTRIDSLIKEKEDLVKKTESAAKDVQKESVSKEKQLKQQVADQASKVENLKKEVVGCNQKIKAAEDRSTSLEKLVVDSDMALKMEKEGMTKVYIVAAVFFLMFLYEKVS